LATINDKAGRINYIEKPFVKQQWITLLIENWNLLKNPYQILLENN